MYLYCLELMINELWISDEWGCGLCKLNQRELKLKSDFVWNGRVLWKLFLWYLVTFLQYWTTFCHTVKTLRSVAVKTYSINFFRKPNIVLNKSLENSRNHNIFHHVASAMENIFIWDYWKIVIFCILFDCSLHLQVSPAFLHSISFVSHR